MKKTFRAIRITLLAFSLLLVFTACSGSKTDMQFLIYNQSTATIYHIGLGPGSEYDESEEIVLYDDFDDQIPAGSTYSADAGIPEKEMDGTWTIYVKAKWEESGISTFEEFEMNKDIYGFSMHDLADSGLGIMAHYEPYDINSGANDRSDRNNSIDYQLGEDENDWRGVYDNDGEIFLEIWGFDGSKFDFEFYLPSSSGERVIRLEGVAEINPDNAKDANFGDVNFYYTDENSIFVTNHSDYPLASGLYFSANGSEAKEDAGVGDSGAGADPEP